MIHAQNAVLRVKRIRQSRNGAFCIADLTTDFGEFKVKDPILDQFEEGEYQADVWISEIHLSQYIAYGKAVTEIRARLHDLQVISEDSRPMPKEPAEFDPLDEPAPVRMPQMTKAKAEETRGRKGAPDHRWDKFKKPGQSVPELTKAELESDQTEQIRALFDPDLSAAIEGRQPVRLDMTIDRAMLREQTAFLKKNDYRFDPKQQTWFAK